MDKKFNNYTFYLDSDHSTTNFDSLDKVKNHVAKLMGVSINQVSIDNDVDVNGHSNVSIKDKFGDQVRVVGFVYGSIWISYNTTTEWKQEQ